MDIVNRIEALIFASGGSITKNFILNGLNQFSYFITKEELDEYIEKLKEKYQNSNSGVILLDYNDNLQFATNAKFADTTSSLLQKHREKELTKTLLEVLAIIAYKQPISRSRIEALRKNISCDYAVNVLLSINLIEAKGKDEKQHNATLYGTTNEFLKKFDLSSLKDLPSSQEIDLKVSQIYDSNYVGNSLYKSTNFDYLDEADSQNMEEIRKNREIQRKLNEEELSIFDKRLDEIKNQIENNDLIKNIDKSKELQKEYEEPKYQFNAEMDSDEF